MAAEPDQLVAPPILGLIAQHVDEAAALRRQRTRLVRAPHIRLHGLRRHDERIAAHIDGIAVAGDVGRGLAHAASAQPGGGEVFTSALVAIGSNDGATIERLLGLGRASADASRGLVSAFGWASAADLRGLTRTLLVSRDPDARALGLAACALHQVDPGAALSASALTDTHQPLAARALDVAGRMGRVDLMGACLTRTHADDPMRLHAARAALMLGDRRGAVEALQGWTMEPSSDQGAAAIEALVLANAPAPTHTMLQALASQPHAMRVLIRSAGLSGQTRYLPWLVEQCADTRHARLAADAFALITGVDMDAAQLTAPRPEGAESGPNDDPIDVDVALDPDEDLAWPDAAKVARWWHANAARLDPAQRWFVGAPLTLAQCTAVLRNGMQRQRVVAALHRTLLAPGTPVFNVAAPAWRQQRLLASLRAS